MFKLIELRYQQFSKNVIKYNVRLIIITSKVSMISSEEGEKEISISITKIFNWPQSESICSFDLIFYPEESDIPIIEKSVAGVFLSNSMNLNSLLKITYTQDQNIIILKMLKNRKDRRELLGQFQIDLDVLREKNVQYFPFGKDSVLQINLYVPMKANSRSSRGQEYSTGLIRASRLNNDTQMLGYRPTPQKILSTQRRRISSKYQTNQRQKYYQNYYQPTLYNQYDPRLKKSFSEKVFTLLQQVKSIKDDIRKTGPRVSRQINHQEQINSDPYANQQRIIKKSMSDGKFKTYGAVTGPAGPSFRREQQPNKQAKPQKHRLILSTLNVVPCDEYYKNEPQKVMKSQAYPSQTQAQRQYGRINSKQGVSATGNIYRQDYYHSRFN